VGRRRPTVEWPMAGKRLLRQSGATMWGHLPLAELFGIGYQEFIIVLIVVFILFGHRLPSIMRHLGRPLVSGPWDNGPKRFHDEAKSRWPTSMADWLAIVFLVALLFAVLWRSLVS